MTSPEEPLPTLAPPVMRPLLLGDIRATGWLKRQLRKQADGLTGCLDEVWPDVRDSGWFGGAAEGWERAPYWLDGLVPLAFVLDDGLAGVAYGPCVVRTTVRRVPVTVTVETDYPFRGEIAMTLAAKAALDLPLRLRIPAWADGATVAIGAGPPQAVRSGIFAAMTLRLEPGAPAHVTLRLPLTVRTEDRPSGGVVLLRGPLLLASDVPHRWTKLRDHPHIPAPAADWCAVPTAPWNVSLVPYGCTHLRFTDHRGACKKVGRRPPGAPPHRQKRERCTRRPPGGRGQFRLDLHTGFVLAWRGMENGLSDRSVTLRDVAQAAGVNISTVSRAMRDDPRLRPATRASIQALARQMKYRPNPFVTAFATHVRNHRRLPCRATVAVLITYGKKDPALAMDWEARYAQGIRERAEAHGFGVDVFRPCEHDGGMAAIVKAIDARGIRGLIVMPVRGQSVLTGIDLRSLAAATIDLSLRHPPLHRASPDYFQGMQLVLDTLHARRYRRIGFCTCRGEVRRIGSRWLGGYLSWQLDGVPRERLAPHINPYEELDGTGRPEVDAPHWQACRDDFARWFEQARPDAIVSNNQFFHGWLREFGLRIPQQVAFAALGFAPGVSTFAGLDQRFEAVGAAAMDLVVSQIYRNEYGLPSIPKTALVPAQWIDGATVL